MNELTLLLNSVIVWAILGCALPCYTLSLELLFFAGKNALWFERCNSWLDSLQTIISALPLLGLLGTISGLLETFGILSNGSASLSVLMSGGIADALVTTEIGLVMAIPGWLMIAWLKGQMKAWELKQCAAA